MDNQSKPSTIVTKMNPLIIEDDNYVKAYNMVMLQDGGYIEILVDCEFSIDKLVNETAKEEANDPDIILKGKDGEDGQPGENGKDGSAGAVASIFIKDLQSDLMVHAYGGGSGGMGGRGGNGGDGGEGFYGADGGDGGNGSDGADGGNGGSGGKLCIEFASDNESHIAYKELNSLGGKHGQKGLGGQGGDGHIKGRSGKDGRIGRPGQAGGKGSVDIKVVEMEVTK